MHITICDEEGTPTQVIPLPDAQRQARQLWAFLVSNLQPEFQVRLEDESGQITRPSGKKLPAHLFERLSGGAPLDDLE
jgi:hypothetical protein